MAKRAPPAPKTPAEVRIERLAADYRAALDAAGTILTRHQEETAEITARYLVPLRAAAAVMRTARAALEAAIGGARAVYLAPARRAKSDVLHGVRCGWRQVPGRWEMPGQDALLAAVREHLPDQADTLIETVEAVRVDALTDAQRLALGGRWIEPDQTVVCAEQATGVEKMLKVLAGAGADQEAQP